MPVFKINPYFVGRLGSGVLVIVPVFNINPRLVGRLGSGVRVSAIVQIFSRG